MQVSNYEELKQSLLKALDNKDLVENYKLLLKDYLYKLDGKS